MCDGSTSAAIGATTACAVIGNEVGTPRSVHEAHDDGEVSPPHEGSTERSSRKASAVGHSHVATGPLVAFLVSCYP